ncbi:MAG: tRNA preQ1(34) S-adenosylmethionine ribosyltransferase-isomerase QueA [Brevinematales bacterium]|nr:tRNA preQ1(34) S-adenosylmethionine ribosyltransferase-isomerase QueA [Brevinematales bacterium]
MDNNDLFFDLPEDLIAEKPPISREDSRLLVVDRKQNNFLERKFSEIIDYFNEEDLIVFNNTKVFKARLIGKTELGKDIELLLIERIDDNSWKVMVKNSKKFKEGTIIYFDKINAILLERIDEFRILRFDEPLDYEKINQIGLTPLPPYIINKRKKLGLSEYIKEDDERYQSVLAKYYGSVAAPTASFHFSERLLDALKEKGVEFAFVTLHIGPGTFKPIEGKIEDFKIHKEWFSVDEENVEKIKRAKINNHKVTAVGTTSVRTLETLGELFGDVKNFKPHSAYTDLFIKDNFRFKVVDRMVTNFHLPYSTLLLLVYAFAGKELIKNAYDFAIKERFRFFSYGDAMFII